MPARPDELFEQRLTRALQTAPAPHISPDFAARVAAQASDRFGALPSVPARPRSYAALTARAALILLLVGMFLTARWLGPTSSTLLLVEATLCLEFCALGIYLGLRPNLFR